MEKEKTDFSLEARRAIVMTLTVGGATSREIAAQLKSQGFATSSQSTVVRDRKAVLNELRIDMKDEVLSHRAIMDTRYRRQLAAHWEKSLKGDADSMRHVTTILKRLCELHGTDEPQKIDHGDNRPVILKVTHERAPAGRKK